MKIEIWQIGKDKSDIFDDCAAIYLNRIKHVHKLSNIFFKEAQHKNKSDGEIKQIESEAMLSAFNSKHYIVLLDERGRHVDSLEFSALIDKIEGAPQFDKLIFCIGGAYGFSEEIRRRANMVMALSALTFPHKMVKLFLIEQLYRAYTIKINHGYHKF